MYETGSFDMLKPNGGRQWTSRTVFTLESVLKELKRKPLTNTEWYPERAISLSFLSQFYVYELIILSWTLNFFVRFVTFCSNLDKYLL